MEKNKKILYITIFIFVVCMIVIGYNKQSDNKKVNTDTNINNEEQAEVEITTIEFDENTNLEEARGMIYEKYSNNNLRIVGAVIQEVTSDYVIVKTYRAGEGTTSIVEEKKINITKDVPVFETIMSPGNLDNEPATTKKTVTSLNVGDHVVIECAEDKSAKDSDEFTALIITKDIMVFDELLKDETIE